MPSLTFLFAPEIPIFRFSFLLSQSAGGSIQQVICRYIIKPAQSNQMMDRQFIGSALIACIHRL